MNLQRRGIICKVSETELFMKSFSPPPQEISYTPWNMVWELLKQGNLSFVLTSAMESMQPTKAASFLFFLLRSAVRYEVSLSCQNSLFTLKKKKYIHIYNHQQRFHSPLCWQTSDSAFTLLEGELNYLQVFLEESSVQPYHSLHCSPHYRIPLAFGSLVSLFRVVTLCFQRYTQKSLGNTSRLRRHGSNDGPLYPEIYRKHFTPCPPENDVRR